MTNKDRFNVKNKILDNFSKMPKISGIEKIPVEIEELKKFDIEEVKDFLFKLQDEGVISKFARGKNTGVWLVYF